MLGAFLNRFLREILIITNIFAAYAWTLPWKYPDPKFWVVILFIMALILEIFTAVRFLVNLCETDFTWRQKWKNFCRFDKRSCKACEHGDYCKYSTCQHKSLRNGRYYLLKILGH